MATLAQKRLHPKMKKLDLPEMGDRLVPFSVWLPSSVLDKLRELKTTSGLRMADIVRTAVQEFRLDNDHTVAESLQIEKHGATHAEIMDRLVDQDARTRAFFKTVADSARVLAGGDTVSQLNVRFENMATWARGIEDRLATMEQSLIDLGKGVATHLDENQAESPRSPPTT